MTLIRLQIIIPEQNMKHYSVPLSESTRAFIGYLSEWRLSLIWVFAWVFIVAFMLAKSFPDLLHFSNRKKAILSIVCSVYCLLCAAMEHASIRENLVGCILLLICLLFVWCADSVKPLEKGKLHISAMLLSSGIISQNFTTAILQTEFLQMTGQMCFP